jgi:hypothetical protein
MGASLRFADIQAPQLAPPPQSPLAGLPELMLAISQHRDAVAQEQQRLALEKQRTESEVASQGVQTAAAKQEAQRKQVADERTQKMLAAHDLVAGGMGDVATQPGDLSTNVEALRVKLIQQNKQLAPFINDAVNSQKQDVLKTLSDAAQARTATTNADVGDATKAGKIAGENANNTVAVATAQPRIITAKADAARAQTEAETAVVQQHLAKLSETYGPNRGAVATAVIAGGGTLAQAYRIEGVPLPAGVDPNWTTSKGTGNAMMARQQDYVSLMAEATPHLAELYKKADPKAVTALIKFPMAANGLADSNTQQYVMHSRDFLAGVLHEESGARLTDAQIAWGVPRYIVIGGDSPATKEAKMANVRAVLKERQKNPSYRIPGSPISDEAQATFSAATPAGSAIPLDGHSAVSQRFTTMRPPK